jgi:hypothetical protein
VHGSVAPAGFGFTELASIADAARVTHFDEITARSPNCIRLIFVSGIAATFSSRHAAGGHPPS